MFIEGIVVTSLLSARNPKGGRGEGISNKVWIPDKIYISSKRLHGARYRWYHYVVCGIFEKIGYRFSLRRAGHVCRVHMQTPEEACCGVERRSQQARRFGVRMG